MKDRVGQEINYGDKVAFVSAYTRARLAIGEVVGHTACNVRIKYGDKTTLKNPQKVIVYEKQVEDVRPNI